MTETRLGSHLLRQAQDGERSRTVSPCGRGLRRPPPVRVLVWEGEGYVNLSKMHTHFLLLY